MTKEIRPARVDSKKSLSLGRITRPAGGQADNAGAGQTSTPSSTTPSTTGTGSGGAASGKSE